MGAPGGVVLERSRVECGALDMSTMRLDETISAIPYLDVAPADENGIRWL